MAKRHLHALSAALCLIAQPVVGQVQSGLPDLSVMGTIPLYWGEAGEIDDLLQGRAQPHWARAVLEKRHTLHPIGLLDRAGLQDQQYLLLAQPRALAAAENVALDDWVRGGGRLLLFADPMMTGESRFSLGDRRRPQDVALLSPILARWGLRLEFVDDQPPGVRLGEIAGQAVPVNLPGRLVLVTGAPENGVACTLEAAGLAASCAIGRGRVLVLADAAVLDLHHPDPLAAAALDGLIVRAFVDSREIAGQQHVLKSEIPENRASGAIADLHSGHVEDAKIRAN